MILGTELNPKKMKQSVSFPCKAEERGGPAEKAGGQKREGGQKSREKKKPKDCG